ncbi:J domain-containing protein [Limnospira fusiformis SAG 85.79]|nr:heat shock protein DnaJ domain protein [Arthrospira platensis C1]QJB25188.1 J domain-containing protein [Limnospira fusiformis SAG 85.79]QNH56693.1 MAG: J domain-containing protein [Limnospira indica BM01]UWU46890.1 DnaJ domain-containing protein [Arthrospira platensis C1]
MGSKFARDLSGNMNNQDLHKHLAVLELEPGASLEEIKASYKELVQIWHPDRFDSNSNLQQRAHLQLQRINESYEILKDYCEHNEYRTPEDSSQNARQKTESQRSTSNILKRVINILNEVPGMTPAHHRDFNRAIPRFKLGDGSVVKTWKNPVGVDHVFIADKSGNMIFGGFVGWIHSNALQEAIDEIHKDFT